MESIEDPQVDSADQSRLVSIAGIDRILVSARQLDGTAGDDQEIAAHTPNLEELFASLARVAEAAAVQLRDTTASKVTVEFGCEFAIESGSLVAIIGKASGKSAFKVGLEWSATPRQP